MSTHKQIIEDWAFSIEHNGESFSGKISDIIDHFDIETVPSVVASRIKRQVCMKEMSLYDAFFMPQTVYRRYNGQMRRVSSVAEETGIKKSTLYKRMRTLNCSLEEAVRLDINK